MKTIRIIAVLLALIPFLSGCDKFNDKRFSTTIPLSFRVEKSDSDPVVVDMDSTLTALINSSLNDVKDNIKSYEFVSITYKVWEYAGAAGNVFDGSLGFGNVNMTAPGVNYEFNDISLEASNSNPNQTFMSFNSQDIDKIQQYFLDTNGLRLWLDGSVSDVPVTFVVAITVNIDAIAEVKD